MRYLFSGISNKQYLFCYLREEKNMKQASLPPTFCLCTLYTLARGNRIQTEKNSLAGQSEQQSKISVVEVIRIFKVGYLRGGYSLEKKLQNYALGPLLIFCQIFTCTLTEVLTQNNYWETCVLKEDSGLHIVLEDIRVPTIQSGEMRLNSLGIHLTVQKSHTIPQKKDISQAHPFKV